MRSLKIFSFVLLGMASANVSFADINGIDLDIEGTSPLSYSANKENCDGGSLSDCTNAKLEPGDWLLNFSYGTVKGVSKCSGQDGLQIGSFGNITEQEYRYVDKKIWTTNENMLDVAPGEKRYCWCKANGLYNLKTDTNPKMSFSQAPWVFRPLRSDANYCIRYCAEECARTIKVKTSDRAAAFFGTYALFKSSGDTAAKTLCEEKVGDYVYVKEEDKCIPVDVCNSSDNDIRSKYCINSVNDIDTNIRGTHARVYSYNNKTKTNKCIVNMAGKSADWPALDCEKAGLKRNEWLVQFPYGTVKGKSKCSGYQGTNMSDTENKNATVKITTTDENLLDTTSGEKNYCWCKATGLYTFMTDTTAKSVFTHNSWVYIGDKNGGLGTYGCDVICEEVCADEVRKNEYNFKQPIFFGK